MSTPTILSTGLLALSVFATSLSFSAITRLQTWEETTKRAAQVSSTAEKQLWRTRTTQGGAAGAIFLSAASSLHILMTHHASLWLRLVPAIALSGATYHFNAFWYSQNPVPMAKQWNEAVEASNQLRTWLLVLAGAWWVVAVLALFG